MFKSLGVLFGTAALSFMAMAYTGNGFSYGGSMDSVKRLCVKEVSRGGYTRESGKALCSCLVTKASNWRDANPDAEYTKSIHTKFAATCVNNVPLTRKSTPGAYTESDWGGQGFASEDAGWGE